MFCIGCIAGYVIGARAGRSRYEQIQHLATSAASSPAATCAVGLAQRGVDFTVDTIVKVRAHAPEYRATVVDAVESLTKPATHRLRASLRDATEPVKLVAATAQQMPEAVSHTADTLRTQLTDIKIRARQRQTDEIVTAAQRRDESLDASDSPTDTMIESPAS